ncbi:unnamed protein product [Mesocestoides corti]|uniref:Uncharacterized protein n=1 Tax=Mesocestoides corti TaxID=53468 RepID=A0A3P6GRN3_MESCO|nr:unnamed protein product [Mesocestoides corti]
MTRPLLIADRGQPSYPRDQRKAHQKPCFEDSIKATFIHDDDTTVKGDEVIEPLHEDEPDTANPHKTPADQQQQQQSKRKRWLRQAVSVDGERVPGKLLHQCSLDHGYMYRKSMPINDTDDSKLPQGDSGDVDLEDFQSQRDLVEQELRRQSKAPPGVSIRDLLACGSIIEDEDGEDEEEEKDVESVVTKNCSNTAS